MKFQLGNLRSKKKITLIGESGTSNQLHSVRDWAIGLGIATLVFLGGVSYVAYDFYTQFVIKANEVPEDSTIQFHPEKITRYAHEFENKENAYNELRGKKIEVVIPEEKNSESQEVTEQPQTSPSSPEITNPVLAQ